MAIIMKLVCQWIELDKHWCDVFGKQEIIRWDEWWEWMTSYKSLAEAGLWRASWVRLRSWASWGGMEGFNQENGPIRFATYRELSSRMWRMSHRSWRKQNSNGAQWKRLTKGEAVGLEGREGCVWHIRGTVPLSLVRYGGRDLEYCSGSSMVNGGHVLP